jgi:predicted enzyme related to lactoylglutathione lyase
MSGHGPVVNGDAELSRLGTSDEPRIVVVVDAEDPGRLAAFWSRATGYTIVHAGDPYTVLASASADRPEIVLQRVPEKKSGKNRVHMDLMVDDLDESVGRLEALGARRVSEEAHLYETHRWHVLRDPEGNEFCVVSGVGPR